jgi:hypothetical protein
VYVRVGVGVGVLVNAGRFLIPRSPRLATYGCDNGSSVPCPLYRDFIYLTAKGNVTGERQRHFLDSYCQYLTSVNKRRAMGNMYSKIT